MLAAPDDEPTGHTGACSAEDGGFEVVIASWFLTSPVMGTIFITLPRPADPSERKGSTICPSRYSACRGERKEPSLMVATTKRPKASA